MNNHKKCSLFLYFRYEEEKENFIDDGFFYRMKSKRKGGHMKLDSEQYSFQLILHSGNARSMAFEALGLVKNKQMNEGEELYNKAKEELIEAQKIHAQMLRIMANQEENLDVNLLLIHAEDHISSTAVACEMTGEFIDLYKKVGHLL